MCTQWETNSRFSGLRLDILPQSDDFRRGVPPVDLIVVHRMILYIPPIFCRMQQYFSLF